MLMLAALGVLLAGLAIGATSIGGVLVVPVLGTLAQVDPGRAVAAASLGFAFTGAAAWWMAPRHRRAAAGRWAAARWSAPRWARSRSPGCRPAACAWRWG